MKKIVALVIAIVLAATAVACSQDGNEVSKVYDSFALSTQIPVEYADGSFMVNVDNPKEIVGWGDYVFVARVDAELRTEYSNVRENENGTIAGKPYTVYSIVVIDNLKGNLKLDEPIEFFKHGGVNYDGSSISLLEGDRLLETGKYYVLIAAAETDGRLGQGMPNSSIELNSNAIEELSSSETYHNYIDYVNHEVEFSRERFTSIYEDTQNET
ncbi:MAG: hypothetical protein LBQ15_12395 [Clostridium sp.]|nr:hypothetical protein [Clostridium sp.]